MDENDEMKEYTVSIEFDIEARDPKDAAQQVNEMMREPGTAWLFTVYDSETGKKTIVDMMED